MLIGTDSLASNTDLSVLREMQAILQEGKYSERELIRAATWDAYEFLEIKDNLLPHFLFPGAQPNIASMATAGRAIPLADF
jgi:cytosine/adenosine deaminase-related metal-dependent hydrolase